MQVLYYEFKNAPEIGSNIFIGSIPEDIIADIELDISDIKDIKFVGDIDLPETVNLYINDNFDLSEKQLEAIKDFFIIHNVKNLNIVIVKEG